MRFIVGLNSDGWPSAIPLDRLKSISLDPDEGVAVLEFRDDPTISQTLSTAMICGDSDLQETLMMLMGMKKKGKRCDT